MCLEVTYKWTSTPFFLESMACISRDRSLLSDE